MFYGAKEESWWKGNKRAAGEWDYLPVGLLKGKYEASATHKNNSNSKYLHVTHTTLLIFFQLDTNLIISTVL